MVSSNDANHAREDEWSAKLSTLPYPPTLRTDNSGLGKPKQQRSNLPVYPHPQLDIGNQLPPIRNLVPGLWEPGLSKSSRRASLDEGQKKPSLCSIRPAGLVWSDGPINTSDRHLPRPQLETNLYDDESRRDFPRQVNESRKRPPPSPIERADHERTAPSNSVINSNRGTISNVQKTTQVSRHTGEKLNDRPRSSSEAAKPSGERPGRDSQQQEILRDPVGTSIPLPSRWLT